MIGRIHYPHISDGTVSPQLKNELRKMVDQINAVLAELEIRMDSNEGGTANGNRQT